MFTQSQCDFWSDPLAAWGGDPGDLWSNQLMKQKDPCIVHILTITKQLQQIKHKIIEIMISFSSHVRKCVCVCMFVFFYCKLWESLKLDTCSGAEL